MLEELTALLAIRKPLIAKKIESAADNGDITKSPILNTGVWLIFPDSANEWPKQISVAASTLKKSKLLLFLSFNG